MKKKIKIYMLHRCVYDADSLYRYLHLHSCENLEYEFVWNPSDPEYLIATELIWEDISSWKEFVKLYRKAKVHIYHAGECIAPDLNLFDYAICFDAHLNCDDRICRTPARLLFEDMIFDFVNSLDSEEKAHKELQKKTGFCNFMYSNKSGHANRTKIFHKIDQYKHVDSLGKYLNNKSVPMSMRIKRQKGWRNVIRESIDIKSNYKFSIAFENASYAGYTSEKILSSLEAHTVPIYWGNPFIAEELNEEAFINCHKYRNFDEVLERIKEIDNDDRIWCHMVSQPWLTQEQEKREREETEKYYRFMNHIFMQPVERAGRKGEGYWPEKYQRFFLQNRNVLLILKEYIFVKAKSMIKKVMEKLGLR
ncbi:MAG: glycosyltransferase family 10 [Roseburia sp.]|nr:glycosyltransferase family 10 [Roseburia sp.]MCM1202064.1 glycosyltransferase family 10 [Bacteroides fragilis]